MKAYQAYLAEGISTFALVFIGAGSVLALAGTDAGIIGIALAHGLVLMAMVYATAHISGSHVNPAVTMGMWVTRKIKTATAVAYVAAQLTGAAIAGFLLKVVFAASSQALNLGSTTLAAGVTFWNGVLVETVLTFFLVFTIFGVAVDKRAPAGVYGAAIGLVLTFDILLGGGLTGAAMNPARAFGPALASGFWVNHLVYWIGPILGGVVAALVYDNLLLEKKKRRK